MTLARPVLHTNLIIHINTEDARVTSCLYTSVNPIQNLEESVFFCQHITRGSVSLCDFAFGTSTGF